MCEIWGIILQAAIILLKKTNTKYKQQHNQKKWQRKQFAIAIEHF